MDENEYQNATEYYGREEYDVLEAIEKFKAAIDAGYKQASLNNFKNKNISFNNLTGELYFIDSSTIKPNQIKAYRVKIIWPSKSNPNRKPCFICCLYS